MKQELICTEKKKNSIPQQAVNTARKLFNMPAEWQVLTALLVLMAWRLVSIIGFVLKQF